MTAPPVQHYIVARGRLGWTVTAESDRVSEHATADQARRHAEELAERDRRNGRPAQVVDLADKEATPNRH